MINEKLDNNPNIFWGVRGADHSAMGGGGGGNLTKAFPKFKINRH